MKKNKEMQGMLNVVNQMSKSEQAALVEQIMAMMRETHTNEDRTCHSLVTQNPAAIPDCYITRRQLHSRPAVPQCACL